MAGYFTTGTIDQSSSVSEAIVQLWQSQLAVLATNLSLLSTVLPRKLQYSCFAVTSHQVVQQETGQRRPSHRLLGSYHHCISGNKWHWQLCVNQLNAIVVDAWQTAILQRHTNISARLWRFRCWYCTSKSVRVACERQTFLLMFALTTLGTPSRPLLRVAVYGLQEEHQKSVSEMWILTSLWRPLNYVQDRMLYSHIVVVSDVYVFFSKYLYKITLFPFLYSLLPNCNQNSAHFQANSSVNFV